MSTFHYDDGMVNLILFVYVGSGDGGHPEMGAISVTALPIAIGLKLGGCLVHDLLLPLTISSANINN